MEGKMLAMGVGARGKETAGKAQRLSLSDKSCKDQLIPVVVLTAAKLWNKCIKPSKRLHFTKQIPDGRISSVWFSAAAWCLHIIL